VFALLAFLICGAAFAQDAPTPSAASEPTWEGSARILWVSRFNWSTTDDIPDLMEEAAAMGFNAIYWQVRGAGETLYYSGIEPEDARLTLPPPDDKNKDPLRIAIKEAHSRGLKLHAWMNCLSGRPMARTPSDPRHLWQQHPDWFCVEKPDVVQRELGPEADPANQEGYIFLNPAIPGVRAHLAALAAELAEHYEIDGICLDYIRYDSPRFSYDEFSLKEMRRMTDQKPEAWFNFRRQAIDDTVREISEAARAKKNDLTISAAVWGDPVIGRDRFFQAPHGWLARQWVDVIHPMIYVTDPDIFRALVDEHQRQRRGGAIVPAIGNYLFPARVDLLESMIKACRPTAGYGLYEAGALRRPEAKGQRELIAKLHESYAAYPTWNRVPHANAGDTDTVGPFLDQVMIDSPTWKPRHPLRLGLTASDASGIVLDPADPFGPYVDVSTQPDLSNPTRWSLAAVSDPATSTTALLVTLEAFKPASDRETLYLRPTAWDGDTDGGPNDQNMGVGQTLTLRPVSLMREFRFDREFVSSMNTPSCVVLLPGNQAWVGSSLDQAVHAFGILGDILPYSPIATVVDDDGTQHPLGEPQTLFYTKDNHVLVHAIQDGQSWLAKYTIEGKSVGRVGLGLVACDIAQDAHGQLYVAEATRRRWWIMTAAGEKLAGPYGPYPIEDERSNSPCLQSGIGVSRDGRRIYIANASLRRVDSYRLANAPAPGKNSGPVDLARPDFRFEPKSIATISALDSDVEVAPGGRIVVIDGDHRLQWFDNEGLRHQFDLWLDDPPMRRPTGVCFFPQGEGFFVACHGDQQVPGQVQLWIRRTDMDPPLPEP